MFARNSGRVLGGVDRGTAGRVASLRKLTTTTKD